MAIIMLLKRRKDRKAFETAEREERKTRADTGRGSVA
jgi:hypothetical protein